MSAYKEMAKAAKCRIIKNVCGEYILSARFADRAYCFDGRVLTKEEVASYVLKAMEVIKNGDTLYALGKLLGNYMQIDAALPEKQRYVLEISRLYCDVKDEMLKLESSAEGGRKY